MTFMFTAIMAGLSFLLLIIGALWFFGKGGGLMNGYNNMDKERKARYDEKALLRFNGAVMLIVAAVVAVCALLNHMGMSWAFTVGIVSVLVMAAVNVFSLRSKRFIKKDAPEELDKNDPKVVRARKAKLIVSIAAVLVLGLPLGWIMLEGTRPINATVTDSELRVRGLYGLTIGFDEIHTLYLDERAVEEIGTGRRRMGHGTQNNLRGSFANGQMLIQNPSEGPTIHIVRIGDVDVFISMRYADETRDLYQQLRDALN